MVEIAKRNDVSERTIYRYKMKKNNELKEPDFTGENEFLNKEKSGMIIYTTEDGLTKVETTFEGIYR